MSERTRLVSEDETATTSGQRNYGALPDPTANMDDTRTTLRFLEKTGFALGHIYNDLCAGVWFSYTLLFFQGVLKMPGAQAGALLMLGQVGDAIATPIVGILTDRISTKRTWHAAGTALVAITFPLIFAVCPWCNILPSWWTPTYFCIVILLFQIGWPIVQIGHLAMIPELGRTQRDRSDLTATRYAASIIANVTVYIVAWAVLRVTGANASNTIGPQDYHKFRDIALILTLMGVSMSVLFHFSISLSNYETRRRRLLQETPSVNDRERLVGADSSSNEQRKNFLKSPQLYQNALLYVCSRLFLTTSLVYMPLWLNERAATIPVGPDKPNVELIATVPLVSFLASFVAAILLKCLHRMSHSKSYLLGSLLSVGGCVWVATALSPSALQLYGVASLFGAGSSITMISALSSTADMIGSKHSAQGGSIYAAVTFCDKLITGVAVVTIEAVKCSNINDCPTYYRNVLAYACGISALIGIFILSTLCCTKKVEDRLARRSSQTSTSFRQPQVT